MKKHIYMLMMAAITAMMLGACSSSDSNDNDSGGPTPAAEQWLLFANDGSANSNNLTVFKASPSSPIQTPIPQEGNTLAFNTLPLGEIHFANGKGFVVITSGLTGPAPGNLASGGLAVIDLAHPDTLETTVLLVSDSTGRASRIVHVYIDPEGKFLWANNDGPSGGADADSVFRVNVDPASLGYLTYLDIAVGNGHHKSAFPRPNTNQPNAKKLFITSSLTERRIDVIDDDPASGTYGQVLKIVRNVGGSPHGMDYSPNSGRAFAGITGGGLVSIDATQLDLDSNNVIDFPDVDCTPGGGPPATPGGPNSGGTPIVDDNCIGTIGAVNAGVKDPSVYKLSTGTGSNPTLFAGYVHSHTNDHGEDMVYTSGYSGGAAKGWLTAIEPGAGGTPPSAVTAIDLGDFSASSFNTAGDKIYVPSSGNGTIHDLVRVIDGDHDSGTFNTVIADITVGVATGENRNGKTSPDGRVAMYPNTSTNTASVIDTETDTVIDTVTLTSGGPLAKNLGIVHLPVDGAENNR